VRTSIERARRRVARPNPGAGDRAGSRLRKSFWSLEYREVRAHAIVTSAVLWIIAAILLLSGDGGRIATGPLKGADFVHFYTLGYQARHRAGPALYDAAAQHELQTRLVPASVPDWYIPVYPPQIAVLVAPFSLLSYGWAAVSWGAVTAALYAAIVWATCRRSFPTLRDAALVVAAAAAFPPFWQLLMHGQTTVVPLVSFFLGWLALERGRTFLSGLAFGLLAVKPQFGLALAVVVAARREWALLGGGLASAALQGAIVAAVFGSGVIVDFAETVRRLPEVARALEPRPYQLHSLKALADLLPAPAATAAWLAVAVTVLWCTARIWSAPVPASVRIGAVVIATVLVSPHLTIYDLTVLVLPLLWLGGWIEREDGHLALRRPYWAAVYVLYALLLVPIARIVSVQPSVLVIAGLFGIAFRAAGSVSPSPLRLSAKRLGGHVTGGARMET
jgi:hypothetical protein